MIQILIFVILVQGCTDQLENTLIKANRIAETAQMSPITLNSAKFPIKGYFRAGRSSLPARVYIEGDGQAWVSYRRPALNPTPGNPIALKLAGLDDYQGPLIYLSRPCQFIRLNEAPECSITLWTDKRYSREAVAIMNESLDQLKLGFHLHHIELVGFSGGGTISVLLAATRKDITSIRTVAGNLDVKAFTEQHGISQVDSGWSLNEISKQLSTIPQIHFTGDQDKVVSMQITASYLKHFENLRCIKLLPIAGISHTKGWERDWNKLLTISPHCENKPTHPLN